MAVYDTTFQRVSTPVRFAQQGRYLIDGGSMEKVSGTRAGSVLGKEESASPYPEPVTRARADGVSIDGFVTGLRLFGYDGEYAIDGIEVVNSSKRGIWAGNDSVTQLRNATVLYNGGTFDSSFPYYGGVATGARYYGDSPYIDAGTESDDGNNLVCCNVDDDNEPLNFDEVDGHIDSEGNLSCEGVCE